METNKYAVDNIVDNVVILENIDNGEMVFIEKSSLDFEINEGDILVLQDNKYIKDDEEYRKRIELIQSKFDKVRRSK